MAKTLLGQQPVLPVLHQGFTHRLFCPCCMYTFSNNTSVKPDRRAMGLRSLYSARACAYICRVNAAEAFPESEYRLLPLFQFQFCVCTIPSLVEFNIGQLPTGERNVLQPSINREPVVVPLTLYKSMR